MTPPLSQSKHADMACSLLYVAKHIHGLQTTSAAAARGTEIHRVIAEYMEGLKITRQQTDYDAFRVLAADSGEDAKEVLEKFVESWFFDSEAIYDTELYIALDKDFNVLVARSATGKGYDADTAYEGTLDLVLMESETVAEINDWKSYYQIVNADSFQSKLYPLLLFMLIPTLEKIRFTLAFVRYGDAKRDVTYLRSDVPMLQALARRERKRQMELHADALRLVPRQELLQGDHDFEASPGRHCTWCPLLVQGCPMAKVNPFVTMKPEDRVAFQIWATNARRENMGILKDWVLEGGPVIYRDANGTGYSAEFEPVEKHSLSAKAAIPAIAEWDKTENDDVLGKATLANISPMLKAKKRFALAKALDAMYTTKTETRFKINGAEDDENNKS